MLHLSYLSNNGETVPASGELAIDDLGDMEEAETSWPAIKTGSACVFRLSDEAAAEIGAISSAISVFVDEEDVEALELSAEEDVVTKGGCRIGD